MKLSVLCPGIRTTNWKRLYDSIKESFSLEYELIFAGPYPLPEEFNGVQNVKYIRDWGSPMRCQQIALVNASGEYITWAADDGIFLPNALNIAYEYLKDKNNKTLVMGKYIEGSNNGDMSMIDDAYYNLKNHDASRLKEIPNNPLWMLNVGLISREALIEIGGWDTRFEVCPMAFNDLAVRLHNGGYIFHIQNEIMFTCSHLPGHQGDHGPVHNAQIYRDQPLFERLYTRSNAAQRIKIDINNWKESPERWVERFGKR